MFFILWCKILQLLPLKWKTFFQNPVEEPQILPESAASANHQTAPNDNVPSKASGKKQKREADKGSIYDLTLFCFSSVITK